MPAEISGTGSVYLKKNDVWQLQPMPDIKLKKNNSYKNTGDLYIKKNEKYQAPVIKSLNLYIPEKTEETKIFIGPILKTGGFLSLKFTYSGITTIGPIVSVDLKNTQNTNQQLLLSYRLQGGHIPFAAQIPGWTYGVTHDSDFDDIYGKNIIYRIDSSNRLYAKIENTEGEGVEYIGTAGQYLSINVRNSVMSSSGVIRGQIRSYYL